MDKQVCKRCLRETFILIQAQHPHGWVCGRCFGQLLGSLRHLLHAECILKNARAA